MSKHDFPLQAFQDNFHFDPATGILTNSKTRGSKALKGKESGTLHYSGYLQVCFQRKIFRAHRIGWLLYYGKWPINLVDHINRIRTDNRIENLREATSSENLSNTEKRANNTSGYRGVDFRPDKKRFRARIFSKKKAYTIGHYKTAKEAAEAINNRIQDYHGDFTVKLKIIQ